MDSSLRDERRRLRERRQHVLAISSTAQAAVEKARTSAPKNGSRPASHHSGPSVLARASAVRGWTSARAASAAAPSPERNASSTAGSRSIASVRGAGGERVAGQEPTADEECHQQEEEGEDHSSRRASPAASGVCGVGTAASGALMPSG
ncbi:hypothetical protein NKG05_17700 [Oerskovia sp. M15]